MDDAALWRVAAAAAAGLAFLHESGILHLDIKPENILVRGAGSSGIMLGDFGLAINTNLEPPMSRVGTLDYLAPEARGGWGCIGG